MCRKHPTPTRVLDVDTGVVYTTHHHMPNHILLAAREGRPRVPEPIRLRIWHVTLTRGRTVVLMRNPYEAIVAFWRHNNVNVYIGKISQEVRWTNISDTICN